MASFIDPLTLILDLLVLVAVAVFYTGALVWWDARRTRIEAAHASLRAGGAVLGLLGAILLAIGLWGEIAWPLPGSYNLLFFDSIVMLAFVLLAFAALALWGLPTSFAGIVSLVAGAGVIYYGWSGYQLGLTKSPIEMFLLYLAFGAAGILAFPATLYADMFVIGPFRSGLGNAVPRPTALWTGLVGLFMLVLVLAGIAAIIFGFNTAWAHLASPP